MTGYDNYGGYGGSMGQPMGGSMGGGYGQSYASPFDSPFGNPLTSQFGGYGTTFGGMGMGGGGGYGGYGQQQPIVPQYQPTVNDVFSQYFSQQYYGGPAFNPFAATSLFGGGYGGGYGGGGGGGGGRGAGNRMRDRRKMFEDLFSPEQPAVAQPSPVSSGRAQPQPQMQPQPQQPQAQTGTGGGSSRTYTGPNALIDAFNEREAERRATAMPTSPLQQPPSYSGGANVARPAVMPSAPERPFMPTISDPDYVEKPFMPTISDPDYQGGVTPSLPPEVREPPPFLDIRFNPQQAPVKAPAASPLLQPGRSAIRRSFGNR
jgi:hypothetical protein